MKKKYTIVSLKKELKRMLRRCTIDMEESCEDHGDESIEFLWSKAECEMLASIISMLERGE